jgi:hypothetical protein
MPKISRTLPTIAAVVVLFAAACGDGEPDVEPVGTFELVNTVPGDGSGLVGLYVSGLEELSAEVLEIAACASDNEDKARISDLVARIASLEEADRPHGSRIVSRSDRQVIYHIFVNGSQATVEFDLGGCVSIRSVDPESSKPYIAIG